MGARKLLLTRKLLLIGMSLLLATVAVTSVYLLTRESQAEKCERLGREARDTEAEVIILLPDDGTEQQIERAIERAQAAETAYEEAGCQGIPGCDFDPPLYTKERCAEWKAEPGT